MYKIKIYEYCFSSYAYNRLLLILLIILTTTTHAAECLPDLGNGNICTAKDFTLTSTVVAGPVNCTDGEIIPGGITVRFGVTPTANQRYDIGFFVGDHGESPIQGDSCTFASLAPIEAGGNFDGSSGNGPYRDLDSNSCGDTLKTDGEIFKEIVLADVLCQDTDNDGKLDIDYALTWQQQVQSCNDPSIPSNFFPPSSSKCKAAIGNIDDIDVLPPIAAPLITIEKSVSPQELTALGGSVEYSLNITNTGTETVTLTTLNDTVFGDVNGMGNCSLPQTITAANSNYSIKSGYNYHCSFNVILTGQAPGSTHTNTLTATAENSNAVIVNDSDDAIVSFVAGNTASIGDFIYNDLNGNGIHDESEPGIADADVLLQLNPGTGYVTIQTATTSNDGYYSFNSLGAGNYRVIPDTSQAPLNDWVHTGGIIPHDITLANNQHYLLADFGFSQAKISVNKTAEPTIVSGNSSPIIFKFIVTNVGAIDVTLTNLVDTVFGNLSLKGCSLPQTLTSNSSYSCQFTEILTGNIGDEHNNTAAALVWDMGQNPHFASDSATVTFNDPNNGTIGHLVWNDININGIFDAGEAVFDDVTLTLAGTANYTITTHHGGEYLFTNLAAGNYVVIVTDDNKILSDYVLVTNNLPYNKALAAGEIDIQANFGYAKPEITITKTANKQIVFSGGGVQADVVFTFVIANTGNIDLDITSINDTQFGNLNVSCPPQLLLAGNSFSCNITQNINPAGPYPTTHNNVVTVTADDVITNTEIRASDNAHIVVVPAGGAIAYIIWNDINGDGIKDSDEYGIDGVSIDLTNNVGTVLQTTTSASGGTYNFIVANGTYRIHITDKSQILETATLTVGADSVGNNPTNDIIINNINLSTNFGYQYPTIRPTIQVTKIASTATITGSESVTFNITVTNTGALDVSLTTLYDNQFGSLNSKGNCMIGGVIVIGAAYSCSFTEVLSGSNGDTHNNIVIAVAKTLGVQKNTANQFALAADKWDINFRILAENIPLWSDWGRNLIIIILLIAVYIANKKYKF
ncbi:MAG: SdrD B-like domain-containing protein [Pseudomonadota bacterium]